jgi:putative holliday junction resolvase
MSGSSEPTPAARQPANTASDRAPESPQAEVPARGRLLGLDFGTRRIGIAVCDVEQRYASPLENYRRSRPQADALYLAQAAREQQATGLVVGLPMHMGGEEGQSARAARRFGEWAKTVTGLPCVFWDERLSSALADEYMREAGLSPKKRKLRRDKVAAQIMLQSYLDGRQSQSRPGAAGGSD